MKRSRSVVVGLAFVCLGLVGCFSGNPVGCVTGSRSGTVCSAGGSLSATLTASGASASEVQLTVSDGGCGTFCTDGFDVTIASRDDQFVCSLSSNAALSSAQAFTLPSELVSVLCSTRDDPSTFFEPVAGTLTIENVDTASLDATISVQLARSDGARVEISNGGFTIGGCHEGQVCSF